MLIHVAKHRPHAGVSQFIVTKRDRLIGKTECITHAAICRTGQLPKSGFFKNNVFIVQYILQVMHNLLRTQVF